jgi:hypothetical protein
MSLNKMGKHKIGRGLLILLVLILLFAWIDGGREPQRLIEQPVVLPEGAR